MYILSDLQEHTGHTCILTDRYILCIRNFIIFNDIIEYPLGDLPILAGTAMLNSTFHIGWKMLICLDAQSLDHIRELTDIYFTYHDKPPLMELFIYCNTDRHRIQIPDVCPFYINSYRSCLA